MPRSTKQGCVVCCLFRCDAFCGMCDPPACGSQFLLLPRATTSLFYPIFVWLDELKLACMGPEWWEHAYKRITQLDATLLTVGIANETVRGWPMVCLRRPAVRCAVIRRSSLRCAVPCRAPIGCVVVAMCVFRCLVMYNNAMVCTSPQCATVTWLLYTLSLCSHVLCCAVLCCAVLCCAVLCCAVLCCALLCCAVLCCAVLCSNAVFCSDAVCCGCWLSILRAPSGRCC